MNSTEHSKYKQANIRKQMPKGLLIIGGRQSWRYTGPFDVNTMNLGRAAFMILKAWEPWFTPAACTNDAKRRDIQKLSLLAPK
ncbi:hypothetical protein WG66_000352 [Moniliophthora roreri]|nr:hypothetical protein WG66_000352 [Moniliophthora roreri]